ncbi:putative prolyl 4-hydroxylase 3 [Bienertia sinuspersici]
MAKPKYGRLQPKKSSTPSSTLIFSLLIMFSFVVLILLALGIVSLPSSNPNTYQAHDLNSIVRSTVHRVGVSKERDDQWVEFLSWEPRAFVYHNFLSKDECEYLITLASPHMEKSQVVDEQTGKSKDSRHIILHSLFILFSSQIHLFLTCSITTHCLMLFLQCSLFYVLHSVNLVRYLFSFSSRVRTSSGTFLPRGRDKIIRTIEQRIADFTFLPADHGEGLQVLHYEAGQKYEPHFDYFLEEYSTANGGQRIATVLMYLSDVEEGGETVFPSAKGNVSDIPYWNELSECGKGGLSVKPKRGDALLFWSMKPDASLDPLSLHAGCPVIRGDKWSATKWIRVNTYHV